MSKNQETALKKGLTFPAGASQPQPQGSLGEKGPSLQGIKGLFKPYKGDLFGTNGNKSGGLLYLSRMNVEDDPKVKAKTEAETKKRMVSFCPAWFRSVLYLPQYSNLLASIFLLSPMLTHAMLPLLVLFGACKNTGASPGDAARKRIP